MKHRYMLCGAMMATLLSVSAQKKSLYFDKIYEGSSGKPTQTIPAWSEFFVNGEGATISVSEEGTLSAKINTNSAFCYAMPLKSLGDMTAPYAIEYALQASQAHAGVDLDMRTPEGEHVSFTIQKQYLISRTDRDTICRDLDNSQMAAFRFVFEADKQTKIYKNGELLSAVAQKRNDKIADPGFEKSVSIDPMWWWSNWSQLTIDGNSPYAGGKSLHWENGWTGQLGAQIPVQPHSTYRLTYWAKAVRVNAWQSGMKGSLSIGGVRKASLDIPAGDTYQKFSVEFTTGNNEERADLEFHNGWNNSDAGAFAVYIDEMELVRLEGEPYVQWGKLGISGEAEFALRYVAVGTGEGLEPVQFADLARLMDQVEALREGAVVGNEPGNYPQYALERLETELASAKGLDEEAEYLSVDAAYARLQQAMERFEKCKVTHRELEFEQLEFEGFTGKLKLLDHFRLIPAGVMNDGEIIDKELIYVTYSSAGDKIAVSEEGILTALEVGEDQLIVTAQYKNAVRTIEFPVEVERYAIKSIEASAYEGRIRLGDATGVKVSVEMTDGEAPGEGQVQMAYQSLNPEIVQVSSDGVIVAKAPGEATVKVTGNFRDQEESTEVLVEVITIDRLELQLPEGMQAGTTADYTLKAYYTDGSEVPLDQEDVVVYSDNRRVIQLNNQGLVFVREKGDATVTARIKQATIFKKTSENVRIETAVSIPEQKVDKKYQIRYDLSAKKVSIDFGDDHSFTALSLLSMEGKTIYTEPISSDKVELSTRTFVPGVYILRLYGKQTSFAERLIIF